MRGPTLCLGVTLLASAAFVGCGLTLDADPPRSAAGDAAAADAGGGGSDTGPAVDSGPGLDAGPVCGGTPDAGPDAGPPPCGPSDLDADRYGTEPECLGLDCVEGDAAIGDTSMRSCYAGPPGTSGSGVCAAATETCTYGIW